MKTVRVDPALRRFIHRREIEDRVHLRIFRFVMVLLVITPALPCVFGATGASYATSLTICRILVIATGALGLLAFGVSRWADAAGTDVATESTPNRDFSLPPADPLPPIA